MTEIKQKLAELSREEKKALFDILRRKKEAEVPRRVGRQAASAGPFPLSFAQERLWFVEQLFPGMPAYNVCGVFRLSGPLDPSLLSRAVDEIVRRHGSLRTVFSAEDGQPAQRLLPPRPVPFPLIDVRALPASVREAESLRLLCAEATAPFDLAAGPLLRVRLIRLGESEHLATFAMHHIVTDGWSMGVFYREVGILYAAYAAGLPSPLPELPMQYVDYALRQREALGGTALDGSLAFWRRELEGVPVLELPTDKRRPAARRGVGASVRAMLPPGLRDSLAALLLGERATLFMGFFSAFAALLHRMTGQDDFAVGSPVANRSDPETDDLIGFFVNTLVLRAGLAGDPPFREVLGRARRSALAAFEHQEVPFERIVEALQPERFLSQTPLFQVMLTLDNTPIAEASLGGIVLELIPLASTTAKFDLGLILDETPEGVSMRLEYDLDLFEAATAERLLRRLEIVIAGAVAAPDVPVSALPVLSAEERGQLLVEWNRTARPLPREASVWRLFTGQVAAAPGAPALLHEEGVWTYAGLAAAASRLGRELRRLGAGPEVPVAVLMERSPELIVALLGVLAAGSFFVPLDPGHPPERMAVQIAHTGARLAVTEERWQGALPEGVAPVLLNGEAAAAETVDPEATLPGLAIPAECLAYVMFTSGSTGEPKGVAVTQRNIVRLVRGQGDALGAGMGPGEVASQIAPAAFDGSTLEIWGALLNGGALAIAPPRASSIAELMAFLARHRVTFLVLTAGLFQQVAEEPPVGLGALRRLVAGGDVVSAPHVRRILAALPGLTVVNGYGPTEVTSVTCCWEMRDAAMVGETVPIGRPIGNTVVYVLDPGMQPVPAGVWGELHAGGDGLARGYVGRPDLTAERFVPDPFAALHGAAGARLYRTGDLVRWRSPAGAEARIEFLGRNDRQVKIRGFRIEPDEVEAVLAAHSRVREAAVLVRGGGADGGGDKRLVAYVVCSGDWSAGLEAELRRYLAARLPEPMTPSAFVALPALPLTPNGKVDRKALAAVAPERRERPDDPAVAPRTPTEQALARLWVEVLGAERTGGRVGVEDSFFELGGHSLLATRLVSRIRATLGVDVPLQALFQTPTVAAIAALVDSLGGAPAGRPDLAALDAEKKNALFELLRRKTAKAKAAGSERILPRRDREAPPPLSFGQERLWFLDRLEPGNTALNMPFALRLGGVLDVPALRRAVAAVTGRHEVLRTVFQEVAGKPVPVLTPPRSIPLPVVDLTGVPENAAFVRQLSGALSGAPFDLATGPVLRACLLRLAPEQHVFLLTIHHIAADGWSMGVVARELSAVYAAFVSGLPAPLPPPPLQYGDFAAWQRDWLQGEVLAAQLSWWRQTLSGDAGPPAPLDLPTDRPRPAIQTYRGGTLRLILPAALGGALGALARREGASLFMTLLAGLQALLHRWSGQDDVLVGSPIAGRRLSETEGMIGFFLNTLVLRGDLGGNPSFRELLGRVRRNVLGAFTHQDIPFEALLAELQPERDLSRTPLFQVFINLLNFPNDRLSVPGLEISPAELPDVESKFDLTLYIVEEENALFFRLVYNADLFDPPRMEELLGQYALLLKQAVAQPDAGIYGFPLITERARAVLPDQAESLMAELTGPLVHERFAEQARLHPERPAVVDAAGAWTYRDLDAASIRLARDLVQAGVMPGAAVAVWAQRSAALPAALLGVLRAGAAFAILDPAYPPERLAGQLARARPRAWVAVAPGPIPDAVIAALDGLPRLAVERMPGEAAVAGLPLPAVPAGAPAYIAFTSGSTGEPKGIVGTHGPLSHFFTWHAATFDLGETDRFSLLSGLAHDPLLRDVFTPLWVGGTLCVPGAGDLDVPGRLASWFARERITAAHLTPAMGQLLSADAAVSLPALRRVLFGGDVLTAGDVEAIRRLAPAARLVNFYGATETPQAMGWKVIADGALPVRLPLGRGIDGVQLLVLGREGGLAGVGEVGEIAIRTPWLALGYLDDRAATAERFAADPLSGREGGRAYRTGDLGRYQPDGDVVFAGRADAQVKIRGFRIETSEVEAALLRHPAVREAAVIARGEGSARFLAAFVVAAAEAVPEARELRGLVAARLPEYMVPAVFVVLPALPLTPNRKVDRRALSRLAVEPAAGPGDAGESHPRTPTEEVLAGIWAAVLRRTQVGIHDSFFDLGGHSLLATQLVSRVRDTFVVEVSLRTLFEAPTVAGFASRLESALRDNTGVATPPLVPVPRNPENGDLPLSFAQERLWFIDQLQPDDSAYVMPLAVRLDGALDLAALAGALTAVVARHEALRTSFPAIAGQARQEIAPAEPVTVPLVDLSALPEAEREAAAARLTAEEARRPFDLFWGPLVRVTLLRLGAAEHLLQLTQHHIVSDGWSMGLLLGELAAAYGPLAAGAGLPALPPLPVQYADYAVWQRSWLQGEALAAQLAYWRRQLGGAPSELALLADRPRPAVETSRGGRLLVRVPAAVTAALEELGRREGATLFMVLLASFQALLFRLTGQRDLTVGSPIAGRTRAELERLIGFFVNTLALRADLSGDPPFPALLARTRRTALEAYTHQDVPFEKLVEELAPQRRLAQSPLFQAVMGLQNAPAAEVEMASDLVLRPVETYNGAARFDLTVLLTPIPGAGLFGTLEYKADLFDAATVERWMGHWSALLAGIVAEPGRPLSDLLLLTSTEQAQSALEWRPRALDENGEEVPWTARPASGPVAALEEGLAFWRRTLSGVPALELPTDRPRRSHPAGSLGDPKDLGEGKVRPPRSFRLVPRPQDDSSAGLLLAAFATFLHRLSGQDGFAFGLAMDGMAILPLRADLSGDPAFRDLVRSVERAVQEALAHRDVPLSMFPAAPPVRAVLAADGPLETAAGLDLALHAAATPDGLALTLAYDRDLFDAATAERLLRHFETLLAGIAASPDQRLSALPILTSAESEQLLVDWNRTAAPFPLGSNVAARFAEQAARTPEAVALLENDASWTYGDLAVAAARMAHRLRRLGVGPEVPVAVLVERSPELIVALLGVLAAGGFFVPLDPGNPAERLASLVTRTGSRVAVTRERWLPLLPGVEASVCLDRDRAELVSEPGDFPAGPIPAESLAYVMFTSGSTGEPKGVAVSHRNILRLVCGSDFAVFGPGEVWAQLAPASFDASTLEIWGPLLNGGALAVLPPQPPSLPELAGFLARHGVTSLWLTAGLFHQMVEGQLSGLAPLRRLFAGGDVLSPPHVRRLLAELPELTLVNGYGPTEGTTFTCCWPLRGPGALGDEMDTVPIGRPIANTRVYVLDAQAQPVPAGVWGELWTGGEGVARGYLGRPELTADRFRPDPFAALHGEPGARLYRTGDLVRWRGDRADGADRRIEFLGRNDRQVKIRGFRIEPGEIEAALTALPEVREAAVVVAAGPASNPLDRRLVAYVVTTVLQPVAPPSPAVLRAALVGKLPEPLVPALIVPLDRLPLTPNGKVDRRALERRPLAGVDRGGAEIVAPRDEAETRMVAIWSELLGIETVSIHDNFFALGGHSLLAARLMAAVRDAYGVEIPLRTLFEKPSPAELALAVTEERLARAGSGVAADLLAELENLSDEEAARWLEETEP